MSSSTCLLTSSTTSSSLEPHDKELQHDKEFQLEPDLKEPDLEHDEFWHKLDPSYEEGWVRFVRKPDPKHWDLSHLQSALDAALVSPRLEARRLQPRTYEDIHGGKQLWYYHRPDGSRDIEYDSD